MRTVGAFACFMLGACLGTTVDPGPGGGVDLATSSPSPDMAGSPPAPDLAGADLAGLTPQALGATCTVDGECTSGMCRPFHQGTVHYCTQPCTVATQTADCPNPPTVGTCTNNGYCKF